ncbi:cupin domain-containing protein [Marmoricola sp. URHB0036]|uniref:cupin domain-containing protein n=1 Tax=Marmoricola sp. URHB0036 TaxID=1298863 RepID=UPI00041B5DF3|nr:cupin domain-containing protein [Marmoricola sp. URHB0036]
MTDALELLSGDAQSFVEKIWASHVHLHQTDPTDLVGLLSFDDVDELLTSSAIRTPAVRLAQDGSVLAQSRYTRSGATLAGQPLTGLVDARKVIDLFEGGATVVLQGLHRYWPPLTRLVAELELALGHPCQANAYLTPPGSQGFAVHSDSHDVFVFQTHGAKLWEVHPAPGESAEVREVLLEPGLSMYLPTGTPHAARAQDAVSLHVTIGINQVTWRTLLDRAVARAMDQVEADAHLPAGYLEDPDALVAGLDDRLTALREALAETDLSRVADEQTRSFLEKRNGHLRGSLVDRMALDSVTGNTRLRRRPGKPCVLRPDGDRLHVLLGDRRMTVPARITDAVERVRTLGVFTPDDLGLDTESGLVLCRRLIREGLLEVVR